MSEFYGQMEVYNDGDRVQCLNCNKPVRVKFFEKGAVVVVSSQEQQELALRCQNCGYVMCDACAHPAGSMFPICPSCNQEWGPYYFTNEAFTPAVSVAAASEEVQVPPPRNWTPEVPLSIEPDELNVEVPDWSKKGRRRLMLVLRILGVLFLLALLGGCIYYVSGPGAPLMKEAISALGARPARTQTPIPTVKLAPTKVIATVTKLAVQVTRTQEFIGTPSPLPATPTPTTEALHVTDTIRPSLTPTTSKPTATHTPTHTPTLTSGQCTPASSITLDLVGQTLCVTGKVWDTELRNGVFYIYLGNEKGDFYIAVYDQVPEGIKKGVCVQAEGEVKKLGSYPVFILGFADVIQICP
jgi:hypothetical protein